VHLRDEQQGSDDGRGLNPAHLATHGIIGQRGR
jgi:hypothetical protein